MARREIRAFEPAPRRSARAPGVRAGDLRSVVRRLAAVTALLGVLGGCVRAAPSLGIVGAYFPAWLLCAVIGLLAAIVCRAVMIALKKADALPFQLFVCTSIGLVIAFMTWLFWFGG